MASEERLHSALQEMRGTMRQRITAELCLLDLCRREGSVLASLTARVESLEQQLAQGVPAAAIAAPKQNVTDKLESKQPQAQPAKPVSVPALKQTVLTASGNSNGIEEFGGDYAAGEDFWRQTLELVRAEKKMSMYSCAKDGRVYSFAKDILVIVFNSAFKSERMNRDDFKSYFEDVLLRLARRPIRLQCAAESEVKKTSAEAAKSRPAPQAQPAASAVDTSQLPENLQKAMRVFGGTITKL